MKNSRWKWIFFVGTTILFLLSLRAYYVGFFNDDAFHIIGSQSLLQGRYAELNQPTEPPLVHYQPGYPLLLTPISLFKPASFVPYQIFSIALTVFALWLAWTLLQGTMATMTFFAVFLLSGLNPLTVSLSGTVLSDVPTFTVTFLFLVLAKRWWTKKEPAKWILLGALGAFAFYLRPVGGALSLALVACLLWEKRWKDALLCAGATALVVCPYIVRNHFVRGESLALGSEFLSSYEHGSPILEMATLALSNVGFYVNEFFVRFLYRFPEVSFISIGGGVVCFAFGLRAFGVKGWRKLPILFFGIYLLVHLIWSRQSGRYLLPVLPLFYLFFFLGVEAIGKKYKSETKAVGFLLAMSLMLTLIPLKTILEASLLKSTPLNTPPQATYDWIRNETKSDDVFASEIDGRLYLLTKRKVVHFVSGQPEDVFHAWIQANQIDYVLVFPNTMDIGTQNKTARYKPIPVDTLKDHLSNKNQYEFVFSSPEEGSFIYRVREGK